MANLPSSRGGSNLKGEGRMMHTATITPEPQRMRALERANEVRLARARLKRQIAGGQVSAAYVILNLPSEATNWPVGELLMSQRRWGSTRARKLLACLHISEKRAVGALTERQRRLLAAEIAAHESRVHRFVTDEVGGASATPEEPTLVSHESAVLVGV
jgi:hypothetical protein